MVKGHSTEQRDALDALDVCYLKYQTLQASILFSSQVIGLLNKLFNRY